MSQWVYCGYLLGWVYWGMVEGLPKGVEITQGDTYHQKHTPTQVTAHERWKAGMNAQPTGNSTFPGGLVGLRFSLSNPYLLCMLEGRSLVPFVPCLAVATEESVVLFPRVPQKKRHLCSSLCSSSTWLYSWMKQVFLASRIGNVDRLWSVYF